MTMYYINPKNVIIKTSEIITLSLLSPVSAFSSPGLLALSRMEVLLKFYSATAMEEVRLLTF